MPVGPWVGNIVVLRIWCAVGYGRYNSAASSPSFVGRGSVGVMSESVDGSYVGVSSVPVAALVDTVCGSSDSRGADAGDVYDRSSGQFAAACDSFPRHFPFAIHLQNPVKRATDTI